MNDIVILGPGRTETTCPLDEFTTRLGEARGSVSSPFAKNRLELAELVGNKLLLNRSGFTATSGIVHFGFWTRRSEVRRLSDEFTNKLPTGCAAQPRGLVFHIPPRNVETVFLYSWIISFLVGNSNVVRLPTELSPAMHDVVQYYIDALAEGGDRSQLFVRYPANSNVSAAISIHSDARIVWGGDAKVAEFSRLPLRNGGKSIWFGDRFSLSVVNAGTLADSDSSTLQQLANGFATDIYVFDQMACSSPHILYVVGQSDAHAQTVNKLVDAIIIAAGGRGFTVETGHAIRKMVVAFRAVATGEANRADVSRPTLTTATATDPSRLLAAVGGGFLQVCYLDDLSCLRALIGEHYQTLSYFGFSQPELRSLFPLPTPLGVTRIVPVGEALNFDSVWDGYDLPRELTRLIKLI